MQIIKIKKNSILARKKKYGLFYYKKSKIKKKKYKT